MSDTEVSLSAEECREYVLHAIVLKSLNEIPPSDSPDIGKGVLLAVARFQQVQQFLRGLGC